MNKLNWYYNIYISIKNISDIDRQKKVWFSQNENAFSSFSEDITYLYDDFHFEYFLKSEKNVLDSELYNDLFYLNILLSKYISNSKKTQVDEILDDENWIYITNHAKKCISS